MQIQKIYFKKSKFFKKVVLLAVKIWLRKIKNQLKFTIIVAFGEVVSINVFN